MKTCSYKDCNYPVFSKGFCKIHWAHKYQKPIKKVSDKKKTRLYYGVCEKLDAEARAKKKWVCFFCGKPLGKSCDHHHVAGKEGLSDNGISLYLDPAGIVLCHRTCHRAYHDTTIEKLLKSPYYMALMEKIHYICKAKYFNMKTKHDEFLNKGI